MSEAELRAALSSAFNLGQTYWQQADSDSHKQNKRADATAAKFAALVEQTIAQASLHAEKVEQMRAALQAFNLKEEWIVAGTADSLTLRVPMTVIQQAAAALNATKPGAGS